jgi:hypothetical protein
VRTPLLSPGAAALCILACAAAFAGSAAAAAPSVEKLPDGSTVTVSQSGQVVHRDRAGAVLAESSCGSPAAYRARVRVLTAFRTAVLAGDRGAAASLVAYPLAWNRGVPPDRRTLRDRAALLRSWDKVFLPGVVRLIRSADPRAVFCKNATQFTLGPGVVWGDTAGGRAAIAIVNSFG